MSVFFNLFFNQFFAKYKGGREGQNMKGSGGRVKWTPALYILTPKPP